jgi:hypothetical protein
MSNIKEETVHAEMTSSATSATEPVNSSRARVLMILFAIGMLVLGLLGGWMLASDGDDPATWGGEIDEAILTEVDELLDDYWAGWDAGDGDAVVALMAADGWFSSVNTAQGGNTGEQLSNYVDRYGYLEYTQVGPTTVIETRAGYEVAGAERVDEYAPEPQWYLDHFVIVEENGQLRIASHQVISTV